MGSGPSPRVFLGVEVSPGGMRALRVAVDEAHRRGATLYAVRAWSVPPASFGVLSVNWRADLLRDAVSIIRSAFTGALGGFPDDPTVVALTVEDLPGRALVRCADRDDDLLIVGTGRPGWPRRIGRRSVARYCAEHAACPVLTVPPPAFARPHACRVLTREIQRELRQPSNAG